MADEKDAVLAALLRRQERTDDQTRKQDLTDLGRLLAEGNPTAERAYALGRCSVILGEMQGKVQELLAELFDHGDVTEPTLAVRRVERLIEDAQNAVLAAVES